MSSAHVREPKCCSLCFPNADTSKGGENITDELEADRLSRMWRWLAEEAEKTGMENGGGM